MFVSCGHSFGGLMLRRVINMSRCTLCNAEIEAGSLVPNYALRAAASAVKNEDDRRLFHNATLRKRRKEIGDHADFHEETTRVDDIHIHNILMVTESTNETLRIGENGDIAAADGLHRGVQYPFAVNEKVVIKGNRRTQEKFVGKEAIITSQCLNGWYLLEIIGSGESVRLQYRSLRKILNSEAIEDRCASHPIQNSSSQ
ncbi:U-BOX DOMAIN-CONTAINING PROTEIN 62-RELATED [Salix koriyanagi]|uniref:U-BOX DOMAIN-CONTAINING PROTEIN 62-RELATED n=1 Tax=Salix koriyanagi TaxID=2511006 RepID=A0A9Q0WJ89_9ROSI|nr:U-BOX DOMAIN-CONTAINING PROTEIN 62-RELATED [Salix koriyanagi]